MLDGFYLRPTGGLDLGSQGNTWIASVAGEIDARRFERPHDGGETGIASRPTDLHRGDRPARGPARLRELLLGPT
jgi:hypothetical protein